MMIIYVIIISVVIKIMIDLFYDDIILYLLRFLTNIDKINLCSINKKLSSFRNNIVFDDVYDYYNIIKIPFVKFKGIKYYIPNNIKEITFGENFNQDIIECIPNGLTHLIFWRKF